MPRRSKPSRGLAEAALSDLTAGPRRLALLAQIVSRSARLGAAVCLASMGGGLVVGDALGAWQAPALAGLLLLAMGASLAGERAAGGGEAAAAVRVVDWFERLIGRADVAAAQRYDSGDLCERVTRQPASAAAAVVGVRVTKAMGTAGPIMALFVIAAFSWQAALMLLLCLPVMIVFFVLVGTLTASRAERQEAALQRVSGFFAERVRCLPTLLACGGVARESARLGGALAEHETRSREVLKVAFLNAAILDFFSSLSVAMLAVFLGLGHLGLAKLPGFHDLSLTQTLSILVLAPEVFSPLRRYAEVYHAASEGRAALRALDPIAAVRPARDSRLPTGREGTRSLVLRHVGAVGDIDLPAHGLVALTGPSGCGKTSLLRALAGVDRPLSGHVLCADRTRAWAAADAWLPGGRLDEVAPGAAGAGALRALGLHADPRFAGRPDASIATGGADLSGGQRLRLSLARAVSKGAETVYADEPTAKLDPGSAATVRLFLSTLSKDRLVVVATHDPELAARADLRLSLSHRQEAAA